MPITPTRRPRAADDRGMSLAGLIVTVGLLGVLAAVVLVATNGSTTVPSTLPTTPTTHASGHTTTTTSIGIPVAALRAECVSDFEEVNSAAQAYAVEHQGSSPPAGDAWATTTAGGGPLLQSWPSSDAFSMRWSGTAVVVDPWHHHRASVGSSGSTSPPSGCEAI